MGKQYTSYASSEYQDLLQDIERAQLARDHLLILTRTVRRQKGMRAFFGRGPRPSRSAGQQIRLPL